MKYFKLLLPTLLLPLFSIAQSNFKPGYVLTTNGDTLKGAIDYKEWSKNPQKISFKNSTGSIVTYGTNNINVFAITGFEYYKRFVLPVSQDPTDFNNIKNGLDTDKTIDTVFLRRLTTGKNVTLYVYNDALKVRYFIANMGEQPVELDYHLYYDQNQTNDNGTAKIITRAGYKNQLQTLAAQYQPGNDKLMNQIQNSSYFEDEFVKTVLAINGEKKSDAMVASRSGVRFFAGAGVNSSHGVFSTPNYIRSQSATSFFPKIDAGFDLLLNKNVGQLIFRTELSFTGNNTVINYEGVTGLYNTDTFGQVIKFKQYIATLNPQIIYNVYNTEKLKFYIGAGAGLNFATYSDKSNYEGYNFPGVTGSPSSQPFPDVQAFYFSLTTKVGCVINNAIEIYAGYIPKTAINDDTEERISMKSMNAGINYLFGKH